MPWKITRVLLCISSGFILKQCFSVLHVSNLRKSLFQEHSFELYSLKALTGRVYLKLDFCIVTNQYARILVYHDGPAFCIITTIILKICYKNINIFNFHSPRR